MYISKIKMKLGCYNSQLLTEIDEVFVEGCVDPGFYKKATIHDYLKNHPGTIQVKAPPYPDVIPATSIYGEKYVKSAANSYVRDNLLSLPRV